MATKAEYKVRVITEDDTEAVLVHLREFFFKNEPINESVKLLENESSRCMDLERYCIKAMHGGISYVAVTDTEKIISVSLNIISALDEVDSEEIEYSDPKFLIVDKFLTIAGGNGTKAILKKFPNCKKVWDVKVLSTDSQWRGKGIAGVLLDLSRKTAYEKGCDLIRMDCSSYYSARVAEKLGFELVHEMLFDDYREDGKPVFAIPHPHTSATTYVQKILPP